MAKLLLEKSAKVNVESESNKDSPLTFACWKGHEGVSPEDFGEHVFYTRARKVAIIK